MKAVADWFVYMEGEVGAVAIVHSYEDGVPPGSQQPRLNALNVPPMGLSTLSMLLVPDVFSDYEDMLEETRDFPRRTDVLMATSLAAVDFSPCGKAAQNFKRSQRKRMILVLHMVLQREFFQQVDFNFIYVLKCCTFDLLLFDFFGFQNVMAYRPTEKVVFVACNWCLIGGIALTEGIVPAVEQRLLCNVSKVFRTLLLSLDWTNYAKRIIQPLQASKIVKNCVRILVFWPP
ncbi:unnamed protein product [Fraxinus pennsylvanica]|uniref:Uncharacterized protein n=1 Tax=Fraxinus pennsylvanica TaxID=56036 RepID=A0AAD1ZUF9_9LAMI|nr:unnamed protein product [Fraxinus pennsylvanica]